MSCLIFTATLNEIDNIESFVSDCLTQLPEAEMLVVDDNSLMGRANYLIKLPKNLTADLKSFIDRES